MKADVDEKAIVIVLAALGNDPLNAVQECFIANTVLQKRRAYMLDGKW